jgi:outer membrane protein with beta-barrel domain
MQFSILFPRLALPLLALSLFSAAELRAQKYEPVSASPPMPDLFEVSLGYNYIHLGDAFPETRNLHGVDASAFVNATSWLAVGGDFMANFGSHTLKNFFFGDVDVDSRRYVYVFGPRITVWHNPQFRAFAEALAGGVHAEAELSSQSRFFRGTQTASADAFATAIGGGFDWRLTNHFSWRILQADYLGTSLGSDWQNNFRASTGIAYSFGQR